MQGPAERALKLLECLTRQSGKDKRLTELLREPDCSAITGWHFYVPACFNDALDIRQTERVVEGKTVSIWTQGANFDFNTGDVLYDTADAYKDWADTLRNVRVCVQVKAATPKSSGETGRISSSGNVTFDLMKPGEDRKALAFVSRHSLSQDEFVRFLVSGDGLAASHEQ